MIFMDKDIAIYKDYLDGLYKITMEQFNGDATWSDVVDYETQHGVATTYDGVQKGARTLYTFLRGGWKLIPPDSPELNTASTWNDRAPSVTYNAADNQYTYSKIFAIAKDTDLTKETVMEKHGLDSKDWECVSFTSNYWSTQGKDENGFPMVCYQTKITVKPKRKSEITYEDIDQWFANQDFKSKPPMAEFVYDDSKECLEIAYADNHLGLLSWNGETGADYDIHIAEDRFKETFADILNRSRGKKYKMINFVTLGDILHIDNMASTTTKGTPQDSDGRITKIFASAVDLICDCVDMLLTLGCPIRYTYTSGNHDTFSGYALAKTISKVYEKNPNITFDISPNPQKVFCYGNTLVGYTHGDMPKKRLGEWMQKSFRKELGQCKFAEVHCGHLHSESVHEECGVLVKHLPTICESSLWEHKEGYDSQKGVMCFVYHEDYGLRDTWYTYL